MAVNWRRGLLRFWLGTSVLWVLLAGSMGYGISLNEPVSTLWKFRNVDTTQSDCSMLGERNPYLEIVRAMRDSKIIEVSPATKPEEPSSPNEPKPRPDAKPSEQEAQDQELVEEIRCEQRLLRIKVNRDKAVSNIQERGGWLSLVLAIPPLAVLVLGYLAAWIVRGFRQA